MSPVVRRFCLLLAIAIALPATAIAADKGEPPDLAEKILGVDGTSLPIVTKEQKDYGKAVGQDVVCLCGTCPRHTITDCACGWAQRNKRVIEAALLAGKTREAIIAAYEKAYGLKVRPTPPTEGVGQLSYMLPYAAIIVGLGVVFFIGLRMRKRNEVADAVAGAAAAPAQDTAEADADVRSILEQELDELDR